MLATIILLSTCLIIEYLTIKNLRSEKDFYKSQAIKHMKLNPVAADRELSRRFYMKNRTVGKGSN